MLELMNARYVGSGIVQGFKMLALDIPFAVEGNRSDAVIVEVYDIPDNGIKLLDQYEEGYVRRRVRVELKNGREIEAWMYVWEDLDVLKRAEVVEGGDWVEYVRRKTI